MADRAEPIEGGRARTVGIRSTREFRDWLNGLARHSGMTASATIDAALRCHAERLGFPPPPVDR